MSQEDILKSMNSRLNLPENQTEGTFGQDILGSVAYELDNTIELKVNTLLDRAFALTAYGDDLDRVGEDNDVYRKLEQPAKVLVTITGTPGIAVETNVQIEYADLIFKSIQNAIIPESGSVDVLFECKTGGIVGNIPQGVEFVFVSPVYGLNSAVSKEAGYDGVDREDDDSYRPRILAKIRSEGSSGNAAHYKEWAEEIPGVDKALVVPLEFGNGTVGIHISTPTKQNPSNELLQKVTDNILAKKPIGSTPTVMSVEYIDINIVATLNISSESSAQAVKTQFEEKLDAYLDTTTDTVSYLRMSDLLFDCTGVNDVLSYTMNGSNKSISLTEKQIARKGTVTINA